MFEFDDEHETRQVLCERCRKFVPMTDIKYLPKGNDSKMALCKKCLKTFNPTGSAIKKKPNEESGQMLTYFCGRCNYKFKFNSAKQSSLRCPYCGRADKILEEKVKSVDHLLKESF